MKAIAGCTVTNANLCPAARKDLPMNRTSAAINRIQPSPTIAVTNKAAELKRQGRDIIGLTRLYLLLYKLGA
jgi:hypothetical protein